jgi:PKHD-type hydroxylase
MNQWWQYWIGKFHPDACDKILETALSYPVDDGKIGHGSTDSVLDTSYRKSKIRWLKREDMRLYGLLQNMEELFSIANRNAFGFDLSGFHEIQFTEYHGSVGGKYDWHHDTTWTGNTLLRRKLSMVIQLSNPEDYDGGDFQVNTEDCQQAPNPRDIRQRGTVIVFPSFLRHRVTPVTRGLRYSLVSWCEGPCFR